MKNLHPLLFVIIILAFAHNAFSQNGFAGQVVDVIDGKTIVIDISNNKVTAVLQHIDVPEVGQPLNRVVIEHLRSLVLGRVVEFKARTLLGNKTIGRVLLKNVDISEQMLRDGAAWLSPIEVTGKDLPEREQYSSSEALAKADKRGVWAVKDLKPSWEFRNTKEQSKKQNDPPDWKPYSPRGTAVSKSATSNSGTSYVGTLINNYDASTKTGRLQTPPFGIQNLEELKNTTFGLAYIYKEDAKKNKVGSFVLWLRSISDEPRFRVSDMEVMVNGEKIAVWKAKRSQRSDLDMVIETMFYDVKRATIEKIANSNDVVLKVGKYLLVPKDGAQLMLYNLLEASKEN